MSMSEVNHLIQQAFIMGQQSVQSAAPVVPNTNNVLLQALMGQTQAPAPPPPAPTVAPSNTQALSQLATLLQGKSLFRQIMS